MGRIILKYKALCFMYIRLWRNRITQQIPILENGGSNPFRRTKRVVSKNIFETTLFIYVFCVYFYHNLLYSSSVTGSSHSFDEPSAGTSTARCANQLSLAAPCQCFTSGGFTTSPGFSICASLPNS